MLDLQDKQWKEFFISEIFDEIQRGKRLTKINQVDGNTPYISSTGNSNGIDNFISNTKEGTRYFENCLSLANSGTVGSTFYHPYSFIASDHVTHLKNKYFSKYVYLFISTQLNKCSKKYNFNREINDFRICREKILLPTNDQGTPDYEFMEIYIKEQEKLRKQAYIAYAKKQLENIRYAVIPQLKDKQWKEFKFVDIFVIKNGFYNKKPDTETHGKFLSWGQQRKTMV